MSLMLLIKCLVSFGWRFLYTPLRAPRVLGQSVSPTTTRRIEEERKEEERGEGEEEIRRRGRRKFLKLFQSYIKVGINIIGY